MNELLMCFVRDSELTARTPSATIPVSSLFIWHIYIFFLTNTLQEKGGMEHQMYQLL